MTDNLISIATAVRLKDMKASNFHYYLEQGRTPDYLVIDGKKYFDREEIIDWEPERFKPGPPAGAKK